MNKIERENQEREAIWADPVLGPRLVAIKKEYERTKLMVMSDNATERIEFVVSKVQDLLDGDDYEIDIEQEKISPEDLYIKVVCDSFGVAKKMETMHEVLENVAVFSVRPLINDKIEASFCLEKIYTEPPRLIRTRYKTREITIQATQREILQSYHNTVAFFIVA